MLAIVSSIIILYLDFSQELTHKFRVFLYCSNLLFLQKIPKMNVFIIYDNYRYFSILQRKM